MISPGKKENKIFFFFFFCDFSKIHTRNLKKLANLFKLQSISILSHPQSEMVDTSFCILVGLFLTKLNHYFNVSIDVNMFFRHSK